MSGRLARLRSIRAMQEEQDRRALQIALAAVAVVEGAIAAQDAALAGARAISRAALEGGDRGEWLMADAQGEVAGWNRTRLVSLLASRRLEVAPAMERFLASRRQHAEVSALVDRAGALAHLEEARREQAAADEWVLGRWGRPGGAVRRDANVSRS